MVTFHVVYQPNILSNSDIFKAPLMKRLAMLWVLPDQCQTINIFYENKMSFLFEKNISETNKERQIYMYVIFNNKSNKKRADFSVLNLFTVMLGVLL